ncbi:two-component system sensor histidine kinase HydH [Desulfobotulus alkaliphilus]|uniref:histidine kinase n=1 Tax=Desulfobotulus alkaliphilus TaxID=622671 RepID=A0A562RMP1_9BACT|nr:ATP-binding protein [Desulfobotulus alkaliphilus]TWI70331.1 two-component system sensor histidine kinase HydH [Desulfobotulus alkaliphilus]
MSDPAVSHNLPLSGSRWLIPALILIFALSILSMVLAFHQRTQRDMVHILQEKGHLLARSLEAGTRTGMMGRLGEATQLKTLFEETTLLPDIFYILLTDSSGQVYINADPDGLARRSLSTSILQQLSRSDSGGWTISGKGEDRHFIFHQTFTPVARAMEKHAMHPMKRQALARKAAESPCGSPFCGDLFQPSSPPKTLVVGMDVQALDTARSKDIQHTFILAGILLLLAVSGIIALFRAEALRYSRLRLKDTQAMSMEIIRSFPAGLLVLDAHGRLRFANKTAETLLQKPLQQLIGQDIAPLLPDALCRLIQNTKSRIPESEILLPAKTSTIPISAGISAIKSENGILGKILVLRDLSDIRRLEEEVRRKEKLAAVGQLAAGVAHEIRNPLSSIKGFATHFRQLFPGESPHHEAADILIREVNRMDRVIGELLEFARPSDIQPLKTLPLPLIQHALRLIAPDAAMKRIQIHEDLPSLPEIHLDPDRFTQVMLNLCLNAIQAMEEGGTLSIRAKTEASFLILDIEDTGKGMAEEDIPKIFDPFYTTKSKGTGLGLAVVEKIITAHGGKIRVDSVPGKGTRFSLFFPL